eukprot:688387-Prorocentrum_minimum.AAC.3
MSGGKVNGVPLPEDSPMLAAAPPVRKEYEDIWALNMVDLKDPDHFKVLYPMLRSQPLFLRWYLFDFVFPITQEYQTQKLSASGQEIGGDLVFGRRMGFSGTPSDLVPVEFRPCQVSRNTLNPQHATPETLKVLKPLTS